MIFIETKHREYNRKNKNRSENRNIKLEGNLLYRNCGDRQHCKE